ncbi:MAG: hypothetical protein M3352_12165 [Bacteroidota bacterium]|nr:hypothetical protein [Bacteroidota bacterium]
MPLDTEAVLAGLLRGSFIPEGKYMEVRQLVRERLDIIDMGSVYVNKMQKCLELMNIKLKEVISQVHGTSGIKMIKAIISGNRDKQYLLSLCDKRIINKKGESILRALEGNYNDTYLFMLEQNMQMCEKHQHQLTLLDTEIEKLLAALCKTKQAIEVKTKPKLIRHHAPKIKSLHAMMIQMYGVNAGSISGFNDYTLLRLVGETPNGYEPLSWQKKFCKLVWVIA